jgi:beta-glucosidase
VYDNGPVPPYHSLIGSEDNWAGTDFGSEGARHNPIAVAPDNSGGLRVTWTGGAAGQIYLQNVADARDMTSYVDNGGALVFDAVVHKPPTERTAIGVHCIHPCVSEVEATTLFRDLPVERRTTVKIPLTCFTAKGLNAQMVNTPFLVLTSGAFDVTFSDIRWEAGVPDAIPCSGLT